MSANSVANELFDGFTFEFYIKVSYKITRQNLRYNLNMKYAENKNSACITRTIKDKKNNIIKRKGTNLDASTVD